MSLASNALVSVEEVKQYLGIDSDDNTENFEQLINGVSKQVESFCGRNFITPSAAITEKWSGDGTESVWLQEAPIASAIAVTSISYRSGTTWTALDSNYTIEQNASEALIEFTDGSVFTKGYRNWKVSYSYGYSLSAVPDDLKHATIILVAREKSLADNKLHGVNSKSFADHSISYNFDKDPENVKRTLNAYKRY